MSSPKVSIILPFYNASKTLKRALNSIIEQSFSDFECIMIDNNSNDNSKNIALEFSTKDPRFILSSETKQGVTFASNKGSSLAKGEFIARMDADDECYIDRIENQYLFLINNADYGAVSGRVKYIAHSNRNKGFAEYVDWLNSIIDYDSILKNRFIESPIANPSAMWRKEVAEKNGRYQDGDFPEDYEMWLRWLHNGVKIAKIEDYVIKWHDSDNRLTRSNELYSIASFYKAKSPYLVYFLKEINPYFPKVAIWGASKISRNRAMELTKYGIEIDYFIDITMKRQINEQIIHYTKIPEAGKIFILIYIKQREIKDQIITYLKSRNYKELRDYIIVS